MLNNELLAFLDKEPGQIQREDLLCFMETKNIHFLNLLYPAMDGRLKTLRIPITSRQRAEEVLALGERVDGSSLFGAIVDPARSDLYAVPVYSTSFLDPFNEGVLDICCTFMDNEGKRERWTPFGVLERSAQAFKSATGFDLRALTELEFYLLMDDHDGRYPARLQAGYHESTPFSKGGAVLDEIVRTLCRITPGVKYAHGEVGIIPSITSTNPELNGKRAEQFEVEFLPQPLFKAGLDTLIAKWVVRNVAARHGMTATFVPKLVMGFAGTGLHVHIEAVKDGVNAMIDKGELSEAARRLIGGLVRFASSITAFGNTCAGSYLRLVPGQEAPTKVCWSNNNRSAMIREPLGWVHAVGMDRKANPQQKSSFEGGVSKQTVELRTPDGSADVLLLLGAIGVAAKWAFESDRSLDLCEKAYVSGDVHKQEELAKSLENLPADCAESATILNKYRKDFERDGIFHPLLIDHQIQRLRAEEDAGFNARIASMTETERREAAEAIMHKDIHLQ